MVCVKSLLASLNKTEADEALYKRVTKKGSNQEIYFFIILGFLMLLILLTNSLMIIGIWKTNRKLTRIHKILIYTSSTDLIVGIFAIPYLIASRMLNKSTCLNDIIAISVGVVVSEESHQTILTLSIMRYVSLKSPFKRLRDSTIIKVVIMQLFISIVKSTIYSYLVNNNNTFTINNIVWITIEWVIVGLLRTTCILSAVIFNLLSRQTLLYKTCIQQTSQHLERQQTAVKRLLMISIYNIVCYSPASFYQVYAGIVSITESSNLLDISLRMLNLEILYPIMLLSPALNSLVYIIWDKRILKYYKRFLNTKIERFIHNARKRNDNKYKTEVDLDVSQTIA